MFLIVGLPGETEQTVKETYNFIMGFQKNKYMYYQDIGVLTVYPGTEVYEIMKQHNLITDDYWMTENLTPCYTVDHTFEELMAFKEDTLNHISLDRITTWGGLKNQWCMIPHIVKYIITYKRDNIKRRLLKLLSLT